jgi:hypothetical protein
MSLTGTPTDPANVHAGALVVTCQRPSGDMAAANPLRVAATRVAVMAVVLATAGGTQPVTEPRTAEPAAVPPIPARKARRLKPAELSVAMSISHQRAVRAFDVDKRMFL